jgi:ribonuclease P protein component
VKTIKSSNDIDRVFRTGLRATQHGAVVMAMRTDKGRDPEGRVAFIAGRKTGGAVKRNRAKRVLREAARKAGGPWPGWDIALIARHSTGRTDPEDLARSIDRALESIGVER